MWKVTCQKCEKKKMCLLSHFTYHLLSMKVFYFILKRLFVLWIFKIFVLTSLVMWENDLINCSISLEVKTIRQLIF